MNKILISMAIIAATSNLALAASAVNKDEEPRTLVVTEGGSRSDLVIAAGEKVDFCANGCFVTMPNGDHEALTGKETVEIVGGRGHITQ